VAKTELGVKRLCLSCGTKFYDLRKNPILCPKCGAVHNPEATLRSRRGRVEEDVEILPKAALLVDDLDVPFVEDEVEPFLADDADESLLADDDMPDDKDK
jgi:uncharacterized protein (TIGR02300 family)